MEGDVVNLLESKVDLIGVQVACVDGSAHFVFGLIDEIADGVNVRAGLVLLSMGVFGLAISEFHQIAVVVLLGDKVEFVLLNKFVGDDVGEETTTEGVYV